MMVVFSGKGILEGEIMNKGEEFTFIIKEHLGVLATFTTGWKKEVNVVEWNGNAGKIDVRDWSPSHEKMSKGITLHKEEAKKLFEELIQKFPNSSRAATAKKRISEMGMQYEEPTAEDN